MASYILKPEAVYAQPRSAGDIVSISSFTAANPTVAAVSPEDIVKLRDGDTLLLEFDTPHDDLDGTLGIVTGLTASDFALEGVDFSELDTADMTASATVTETAPEPPEPPPDPPTASEWAPSPTPPPFTPDDPRPSPGNAWGYFPSPGIGPMPVAPHPGAPPAAAAAAPPNILTANDVVQKKE
jgi:hypothetical protein